MKIFRVLNEQEEVINKWIEDNNIPEEVIGYQFTIGRDGSEWLLVKADWFGKSHSINFLNHELKSIDGLYVG